VVCTGVDEITPTGIRAADGTEHAFDAIVCATGFDCSHRPAFPVIGRSGQDLAESWKEQPRHYFSVAAPGFPNYFSKREPGKVYFTDANVPVLGGPNSPIANGSLISGLETEINYAFACLRKMQTENIASMDVKEEVVDDFLEHRDSLMDAMVWSGGCRSWYASLLETSDSEQAAYIFAGTRTARSMGR
jgi:cation diffusion facilitator CzcD-associated flavoprotein CzcO